jgi:hypothetical protein
MATQIDTVQRDFVLVEDAHIRPMMVVPSVGQST